jgi:hypothetical protein
LGFTLKKNDPFVLRLIEPFITRAGMSGGDDAFQSKGLAVEKRLEGFILTCWRKVLIKVSTSHWVSWRHGGASFFQRRVKSHTRRRDQELLNRDS